MLKVSDPNNQKEQEGYCLDQTIQPEQTSDLSPVPVPEVLADLSMMEPFHLNELEPIDDFASLSLHVALLTGTVKMLWDRLQQLGAFEDDD